MAVRMHDQYNGPCGNTNDYTEQDQPQYPDEQAKKLPGNGMGNNITVPHGQGGHKSKIHSIAKRNGLSDRKGDCAEEYCGHKACHHPVNMAQAMEKARYKQQKYPHITPHDPVKTISEP